MIRTISKIAAIAGTVGLAVIGVLPAVGRLAAAFIKTGGSVRSVAVGVTRIRLILVSAFTSASVAVTKLLKSIVPLEVRSSAIAGRMAAAFRKIPALFERIAAVAISAWAVARNAIARFVSSNPKAIEALRRIGTMMGVASIAAIALVPAIAVVGKVLGVIAGVGVTAFATLSGAITSAFVPVVVATAVATAAFVAFAGEGDTVGENIKSALGKISGAVGSLGKYISDTFDMAASSIFGIDNASAKLAKRVLKVAANIGMIGIVLIGITPIVLALGAVFIKVGGIASGLILAIKAFKTIALLAISPVSLAVLALGVAFLVAAGDGDTFLERIISGFTRIPRAGTG